jgi:hypothetical protein
LPARFGPQQVDVPPGHTPLMVEPVLDGLRHAQRLEQAFDGFNSVEGARRASSTRTRVNYKPVLPLVSLLPRVDGASVDVDGCEFSTNLIHSHWS